MSASSPAQPTLLRRALAIRLVGVPALAMWIGCAVEGGAWHELDAGPCGRGKARSCTCPDGTNGIAQCAAGSDWGECYCPSDVSDGEGPADAGVIVQRDPSRVLPSTPVDAYAAHGCEGTSDFRAHAPGDFGQPYAVPGHGASRACFFFRVPKLVDTVALGFSALADQSPSLRAWTLYGLDVSEHADGEVAPCQGAEASAYPLVAFAPGVEGSWLPGEAALAIPNGPGAGLVLVVDYDNASAEPHTDRTGVRMCTAPKAARPQLAAVHTTGSHGICIPPAARDFVVAGSCRPRSDLGAIHILDVWPSLRQRGKRMELAIVRANGQRELLHDAPFEFRNQRRFAPVDVQLNSGDSLETRCFYDNTSERRVSFGGDPDDENCFGFVTAWPAGALSSNEPNVTALLAASGMRTDRSCIDPLSILRSCNGVLDSL